MLSLFGSVPKDIFRFAFAWCVFFFFAFFRSFDSQEHRMSCGYRTFLCLAGGEIGARGSGWQGHDYVILLLLIVFPGA